MMNVMNKQINKQANYILEKPDPAVDAELMELEESRQQLTWFIIADNQKIGIAAIHLVDDGDVPAPSVTIMIDDEVRRGHGIGTGVIKEMIKYTYCNLPTENLNARYLIANKGAEKFLKKQGFEKDGDVYDDDDGQKWQNVSLSL